MKIDETSYGLKKRIAFVSEIISKYRPSRILDFGCGNGTYLTFPLARTFPAIDFVGADNDPESINYAKENYRIPNVDFLLDRDLPADSKFDLIIVSEVIEHIEAPAQFLRLLAGRLADGGKIVVTVPNGYGPYEIATFAQVLLQLAGIWAFLMAIKKRLSGKAGSEGDSGTLSLSPHVNFFSWAGINKLFKYAGFDVVKYQPRTFLCGIFFDQLLRNDGLTAWNAKAADRLPPHFNSDWMFLIEKSGSMEYNDCAYQGGGYSSFRRNINKNIAKKTAGSLPYPGKSGIKNMVNTEEIYDRVVKELAPILVKLDYEKISTHGQGLMRYGKDPVYSFCHAEKKRFLMTFNFMVSQGLNNKSRYLDLGTFIPIIPLMLKEAGANVEAVEKFSLYGDTLKPIVDLLEKKGITIHDLDIINDNISKKFPNDHYDFISCEAVIEHLHGSPVKMLAAAKQLLKPHGKIVVVVPNIASLMHRATLLFKGVSPFPPIEGYLASEYPFIGHNREYSLHEFRYLLNRVVGFKEVKLEALNSLNWTDKSLKWKSKIIFLLSLAKKEFMEVFWYAGEKI